MNLTDLITSKSDGRLSEAKIWGHIGKAILVWIIATNPTAVLQSWDVMTAAFIFLVAPDILKKYIAVRAPHVQSK